MAQGPRTSGRIIKPRLDPEFAYDPASIQFLQGRRTRENHQLQDSTSLEEIAINSGKNSSVTGLWSDIDLPLINESTNIENQNLASPGSGADRDLENGKEEEENVLVNVNIDTARSSSTRFDYLDTTFLSVSSGEDYNSSDMEQVMQDNIFEEDNRVDEGVQSVHTESVEATASGLAQPIGLGGASAQKSLDMSGIFTMGALLEAVKKIDKLSNKVSALDKLIVKQNTAIGSQHSLLTKQHNKIQQLEQNFLHLVESSHDGELGSDCSEENASQKSGHNSAHESKKSSHKSANVNSSQESGHDSVLGKGKLSHKSTKVKSSLESGHKSLNEKRKSSHKSAKVNSSQESGVESAISKSKSSHQSKVKSSRNFKKSRVEEEKARQYKVLSGQLSGISDSDSTPESSSAESEEVNSKTIKKKMTKKQRNLCSSRVSNALSRTGSTFPQDEFDSTASSGKESCDLGASCKHSKKVKSGSKIKKRPVVRTELWPHTLLNEEEGGEIDSENIGFSKFNEYFAEIISTCKSKSESRGRAKFLQAISTVLGCLQWPEARNFHNLVLHKIEQGRVEWSEDFSALADSFIEKKMRSTLRANARQTSTGYGGSRARGYGRGTGYGSRNPGQRFNSNFNSSYNPNFNSNFNSGRGKPIYGAICWQWNSGTCSYGANCKRWHCCKACADAGKLGEQHKASSHDSSGARPTQQV